MKCEKCKNPMETAWHCFNCGHDHVHPPISEDEILALNNPESTSWVDILDSADNETTDDEPVFH
mgnify:CR=1 FL=1|jgi:hypothetical protein